MLATTRTRTRRYVAALALGLHVFSNPGLAADLIDLGFLPEADSCLPSALSPDGTVAAGTCRVLELRPHPTAFYWTRGQGLRHLGALPSGALSADVNAVSEAGRGIVGIAEDIGRGNEGFLWTPEHGLKGLGNPEGLSIIPTVISSDGAVVFGTGEGAATAKPYRWTPDRGWLLLPGIPRRIQTEVYAGSHDGRMIAGRAWFTGSERTRGWAFVWSEQDGLVNLETARDDDYYAGSTATALSRDGLVAAGDGIFAGRREAFRWTKAGGMTPLGVLPGERFSETTAMSGDGGIIVGQSGGQPFWWDSVKGLRSLRAVLEQEGGRGSILAGWRLTTIEALSADGKVLAGRGINPAGEFTGWVLDLR